MCHLLQMTKNKKKNNYSVFQLEDQTPSYFHNPKKTHPYADPLSSQNNNICQTNLTYSTLSNSKKRHNNKNDGTTTRNEISQQQQKEDKPVSNVIHKNK